MKSDFSSYHLKGGIMRKNIGSFLIAGSLLGMIGMSMPAVAMADDGKGQIVNATCQFGNPDPGAPVPGTRVCGSGGGEVASAQERQQVLFFN